MTQIGVVYHPHKTEALDLARVVGTWLEQRQIAAWLAPLENDVAGSQPLAQTDLLVVLGGDGATLRAARLAAPFSVPVFCINMGRVGFLSEADPEDWPEKLTRFLAGDYWLEHRIMLQAQIFRHGALVEQLIALNDVVVGRGTHARVVRLALYVDDDWVTTYTADGLIVATPTGSTAYSMAAGGPLLPPELKNFLVIPVAPHLSLNRPLVLHEEAVITIEVLQQNDAAVTADGQAAFTLDIDDRVVLQRGPWRSRFVRLGSSGYFYRRLMRRLGVHRQSERDD